MLTAAADRLTSCSQPYAPPPLPHGIPALATAAGHRHFRRIAESATTRKRRRSSSTLGLCPMRCSSTSSSAVTTPRLTGRRSTRPSYFSTTTCRKQLHSAPWRPWVRGMCLASCLHFLAVFANPLRAYPLLVVAQRRRSAGGSRRGSDPSARSTMLNTTTTSTTCRTTRRWSRPWRLRTASPMSARVPWTCTPTPTCCRCSTASPATTGMWLALLSGCSTRGHDDA